MKKSEQLWKYATDSANIADETLDIYSSKCCNSGYAPRDINHSVATVLQQCWEQDILLPVCIFKESVTLQLPIEYQYIVHII